MNQNPFSEVHADGTPHYELKQGLVLYTKQAPGPKQARSVYELYLQSSGNQPQSHPRLYRSTAMGAAFEQWNNQTRKHFEQAQLPALRSKRDWGYVFWDGQQTDSWQFMFHGFRPHTEKGKASFYRFEFDWSASTQVVKTLAFEMARKVPFHTGFAGYFFQADKRSIKALDKMYAVARRYWGVNAYNLDVTINFILAGYLCVSWLTFIGRELKEMNPEAVEEAKKAAYDYLETDFGIVFQAGETPILGDRNRQETMDGYFALARALLPLQLAEHAGLGGSRWDAESTMRWIRRFTQPEDF